MSNLQVGLAYAAVPSAVAVNFAVWFLGRRLPASTRKRLALIAWTAITLAAMYYGLMGFAIVFLFFAALTTSAVAQKWDEGDGMGWFVLIGAGSAVALSALT